MRKPAHTPYDGTSRPFTIDLKPLNLAEWIEVDGDHAAYIAEKTRLYEARRDDVFMAEPDTEDAQREVLDLVEDHLARHVPALAARSPQPAEPPLIAASLMVQEDLVLMRRGPEGWRLAAAALCFPSSWTLSEKFGRPLADIHGPVPEFGRDTRNAGLIERMFDNLQGQCVIRWNWSLQDNPALYHPLSQTAHAGDRPMRFSTADADANAFIRVERQTLRKLPRSGDILFTIRIHLYPLRELAQHPERKALAASFADQIKALDAKQLAYKGLAQARDRLVARLRAMASAT